MLNLSATRRLFALPLALTLVTGCGLRGSGTPATEVREIESFDEIAVGGAFDLIVYVHPSNTHEIEVTADDNIVPKIRTTVSGGELEVRFEDDVNLVRPKVPIEIEVWTPSLAGVDVSGAADIRIDGLHGERFELALSGASDSTISGAVEQFAVNSSGAGDLDAKHLQAKSVELDLSGSAAAEVWANDYLEVHISGAAKVGYWGTPATVHQDISGSGSLQKRD